jgi:hypothetical protein
MDKQYFHNRFCIRGLTVLGIFNTLLACLFNIALVKRIHANNTIDWFWDKGTNHPPAKE